MFKDQDCEETKMARDSLNWTSAYTVGQSVDYFVAPAVGWEKAIVTEIGREFIRIQPNETSFIISVSDRDRVKPV
jgi:hypothetical protein